ncbi:unnamed protein product [Merluccius merluccius]
MGSQRSVVGLLRAAWVWMLAPTVSAHFLGDSKAVLSGCEASWTLQVQDAMPRLYRMTVCVHVCVLSPGAWVAFSYRSAHGPRPDLGLEGDDGALYGWLLGVRHRFPMPLPLNRWRQVCLRRDVHADTFTLSVDGMPVAERRVIARAIPPSGSLRLGCRARDHRPGAVSGRIELYLFRVWPDLAEHALCEDGSVIGWDSEFWGVTSSRARERDDSLACGEGAVAIQISPRLFCRHDFLSLYIMKYVNRLSGRSHSYIDQSATPYRHNSQYQRGTDHSVCQRDHSLHFPGHPPDSLRYHGYLNGRHTLDNSGHRFPSNGRRGRDYNDTQPRLTSSSLRRRQRSQSDHRLHTEPSNHSSACLPDPAPNAFSTGECLSPRQASAVFRCDRVPNTDTPGDQGPAPGGPRRTCPRDSPVQELQISCEKVEESTCADCSMLMRFSYPVPVCGLQYQIVQSFGRDLRICSARQVQRVGGGLCVDVAPSSGGLVRCSPVSPLVDVCQADTPSHFTWIKYDSLCVSQYRVDLLGCLPALCWGPVRCGWPGSWGVQTPAETSGPSGQWDRHTEPLSELSAALPPQQQLQRGRPDEDAWRPWTPDNNHKNHTHNNNHNNHTHNNNHNNHTHNNNHNHNNHTHNNNHNNHTHNNNHNNHTHNNNHNNNNNHNHNNHTHNNNHNNHTHNNNHNNHTHNNNHNNNNHTPNHHTPNNNHTHKHNNHTHNNTHKHNNHTHNNHTHKHNNHTHKHNNHAHKHNNHTHKHNNQ